jgi:beta-aspartyl-peptidase (threonine type)
MGRLLFYIFSFILLSVHGQPVAIVIHGGAGTITKASMSPEREKQYRAALDKALRAGYTILEKGGTSLDAIQAVIMILEDDPLFNAGKGSVLNNKGVVEMDASIMDGRSLKAGSVAGIHHVKNPITAARAVMDKSEHVMMVGDGAEQFAKRHNIVLVDSSYFITPVRQEQLKKVKQKLAPDTTGFIFTDEKFGTVGAVAIDKYGNIAAGTSTGGMTNKKYGRVGDSPIIGAGTYANNRTCAISSTGHGEYFIREVAAHQVSALMEIGKLSLREAMQIVIQEKLKPVGGEGGMIGIDARGNFWMEFNSEGMYRGYMNTPDSSHVFIYRAE